ncbi:MAG: triacylglycerol lipase [Alteromonadaceae bacterium]
MADNTDSKLKILKQKVEKAEVLWRERLEKIGSKVKKNSGKGLSILNGIVGDYLAEKGVAIAVQMAFYLNQKPLKLTKERFKKAYPKATGKICILVHGLGCNESVWELEGNQLTTYASMLADDLGYTPMYVRYNTGLHISHNGQMLSQMLSELVAVYPVQIDEIILINHSMGGLVARSACFYGESEKKQWIDKIRQLYFIGSPHLGAHLEKFGNVVSNALRAAPLPYTRFVGDIIDTRSAGIKDLRYGYVRDEDWEGQDPDDLLHNNKQTTPLLENAEHFVITGTVHKDSNHILSQLFGDALVSKNSATGQSKHQKHNLPFLPEHHREFTRIHHVRLAHSLEIYSQIKAWVAAKPN